MDVFAGFQKTKDFLVCVDSDGCIFNNMELKHKECFCPATVNVWGLQNVSKYAREVWEFVNLYSRSRGMNRFPALLQMLDLLFERPQVLAAGVEKPELAPLRSWVETTPTLSATALEAYQDQNPNEVLERALRWSKEVDENITRIVHGIWPFPDVKDTFKTISQFADIVIVSATPNEALTRELHACGVDELVATIAGQEAGTKAQSIARAMGFGYTPEHVLKVGDAPGDLKAAQQNGVLYYPIIPGQEDESWKQLRDEVAEHFHAGKYAGACMDAFVDTFLGKLPETPPWSTNS